jgi:hypothetical protein
VWAEGVDALLPVTHKVFLMSQKAHGIAAAGDWDHVRDIVGDLMEPTDEYPPRYRVRSFPDEAMLARIGNVDRGLAERIGGCRRAASDFD